jgi:hypothetical protein
MALRALAEAPAPSLPSPTGSPTRVPAPAATGEAASTDGPSPFARLLRTLGNEVDTGERTMKTALSGRDLGAQELIALQAGVYRYSEAIDLASKLVDRATNGVKTVLSGQ